MLDVLAWNFCKIAARLVVFVLTWYEIALKLFIEMKFDNLHPRDIQCILPEEVKNTVFLKWKFDTK